MIMMLSVWRKTLTCEGWIQMITLDLDCQTSDFFSLAHTIPDGVTWRIVAIASDDRLDQLAWAALQHTLKALGFVYFETQEYDGADLIDILWINKDAYIH